MGVERKNKDFMERKGQLGSNQSDYVLESVHWRGYISSGAVEGERSYPKYLFGETPFPKIISWQGRTMIQ